MANPDAASNPTPAPPTASASRNAKPVPVADSAKTGGDPFKASGKKPNAPIVEPPAKQDPPAAG